MKRWLAQLLRSWANSLDPLTNERLSCRALMSVAEQGHRRFDWVGPDGVAEPQPLSDADKDAQWSRIAAALTTGVPEHPDPSHRFALLTTGAKLAYLGDDAGEMKRAFEREDPGTRWYLDRDHAAGHRNPGPRPV